MKQKLPRWKAIAVAVVRRYLALDMTVYAGSATLFLLTASFPLLMWVLMLVNLLPGFSVEGVAELLADFMPQIPAVQTSILQLLQNLSGQSAQFAASLAVLTTIVSASGGISALQIGLQRLTPGSKRTFLNRLLAIGYTFVFELLLLVMLALQGMKSLFARFADTLPFFRHYAPIVHQLQRIASIGQIVAVPLLFGLLLLIYTYVPGGRRTLRSQLPGAVFATAGWLIFSRVFSFYIVHFWRLSYIYGSLTAVILVILWLYVIINLLFIGAGLNAELLPKGFSPGGEAVRKAD
ncbi:YihY/virulence factor BrkB family protein [uncultured Gemmiger sp.]|uniref:YihY/virulence factor BrkB family protein n=1 Tax=uncultured Gemmiger sp. TaxID=1623490 RepID=UPI0025FA36BE|nr:YihY/virulence factor BrkB family protein [uncultured Gemmiger sp.]